jgi:hypothetical protein
MVERGLSANLIKKLFFIFLFLAIGLLFLYALTLIFEPVKQFFQILVRMILAPIELFKQLLKTVFWHMWSE